MEVLHYYKLLIGNKREELQHVDIEALRKGPQLQDAHKISLTNHIIVQEIRKALHIIAETKSPGIEGYASKFFKKTWEVTGSDVTGAVCDFFSHTRLFVVINCALVTLIPKSPEARRIKDMRPIACFSTIYKVISKILTSRLRKVINSVIDDSQAAFISGRVIHDNIIIAQKI